MRDELKQTNTATGGSFLVTISRDVSVVAESPEEAIQIVSQKHGGFRVQTVARQESMFVDFLSATGEVLCAVEEHQGYDVSLTTPELRALLNLLMAHERPPLRCPGLAQEEGLNLVEKLEDALSELNAKPTR